MSAAREEAERLYPEEGGFTEATRTGFVNGATWQKTQGIPEYRYAKTWSRGWEHVGFRTHRSLGAAKDDAEPEKEDVTTTYQVRYVTEWEETNG